MLFDTDVLIWAQRGNKKAAHSIEQSSERIISVFSSMELMQGARDRQEHKTIKTFLADFGFKVIPFSENIGHRASIYIEEYALSSGVGVGDAIIAATAVENNLMLLSGNARHFKAIRELSFKAFLV
jgi:predicted nucleic acid-binding protein